MPEQPPPRHDPGQPGVAELDHARTANAPIAARKAIVSHPDPELVDDREEDQRQQDGLGVVDRVGHGQQAERAHRVDLDGRHRRHGAAPLAYRAGPIGTRLHRAPVSGIVDGPPAQHANRGLGRREGPPMPTVLIVDDEQHIRLLIEQTLEELEDDGVELLTATERRGGRRRRREPPPGPRLPRRDDAQARRVRGLPRDQAGAGPDRTRTSCC